MTNSDRISLLAALLAVSISQGSPAYAQEDDTARLGSVHFATSCNEAAQRRFDRGMRYEHSFWYSAANEVFDDVLKADSTCAIAYWGKALALLSNPHNPVPAANLPLGLAAIEKAKSLNAKTKRERDLIDALSLMYVDYDKLDHRTRIQKYLAAMEQVASLYPDDDEVQLYYAITLNTSASPNDKTYSQQLKGASIVEPIFKRQPNHPGVPHYLIHLYDYPAIADKGMGAALTYAKIAPDAPHAQHMPSHIFTRVGAWKDSINSNLASAKAAKATREYSDQMHATDYLIYGYLQLARDKEAETAVSEQVKTFETANAVIRTNAGAYALAAAPARYSVERGDWKSAATLIVRNSEQLQSVAITHFARALGASHIGSIDQAQAEVAKLAEISTNLREAKDMYWSEIVDIQRQVASAWLLFAQDRRDEALQVMSAAADAEDKTEKSPVTPGPLAPARELYGYMLLESGKADAALGAFEATLRKEPNRFNTYAGAARAAEKAGDQAKAKAYYGKLLELADGSASDRPVLTSAAGFTAR